MVLNHQLGLNCRIAMTKIRIRHGPKKEPRLKPAFVNTTILDFMTDGETPHYLVDLDLDRVSDLCISNKDHKSFNSGNAVAFTSNVLNIDVVLFSGLYRSRSAH